MIIFPYFHKGSTDVYEKDSELDNGDILEQDVLSSTLSLNDIRKIEIEDNSKLLDTPEIKTAVSVHCVQEVKRAIPREVQRKGSNGASRRRRYDTDRV